MCVREKEREGGREGETDKATRSLAGLMFFPRKGEASAYVGRIENLEDLNEDPHKITHSLSMAISHVDFRRPSLGESGGRPHPRSFLWSIV